ncbi:hypothetical protein GQ457_18G019500 [Hibiscus cannabinus]
MSDDQKRRCPQRKKAVPLVTVGDVLEPLEHFNSLFLQFWSLGYRYMCLGIDTQVQYRYPKWSLELGYRYQGLGNRVPKLYSSILPSIILKVQQDM